MQGRDDPSPHLFFLGPFIPPPLQCEIADRQISSRVAVIGPVEFLAPQLDNVFQAAQENPLNSLIQLRDPMIEIGIAFKIQSVDLYPAKN